MLMIRHARMLNCLFRVVRRSDALIETDGRLQLALQLGVIDDVVVAQRLLDHHQIEFVQSLQMRRVRQRVSGVRIRHQTGYSGKRSRTRRITSTSQPGLIFILMRW